MKHEGEVPACPHAVRFGNDERTPELESDEHGQVVKPVPCDPPGKPDPHEFIGSKRKR